MKKLITLAIVMAISATAYAKGGGGHGGGGHASSGGHSSSHSSGAHSSAAPAKSTSVSSTVSKPSSPVVIPVTGGAHGSNNSKTCDPSKDRDCKR